MLMRIMLFSLLLMAGADVERAQAAVGELRWSFEPAMIFPADRSLQRPEDGVVLPDGRLVVADQAHGLRLVRPDGSSRPFGRFAEAGYVHRPPEITAGANGVTLEPGGEHILVADVYRGGIYRVEVATEETALLYQHAYGVNVARRDSRGGTWFSQSTRNAPEHGEAELMRALNAPVADGGVFYLPPVDAGKHRDAVLAAGGLYFANGIALDEQAGLLYVAELMAKRVLQFRMDTTAGELTDRSVLLETSGFPDNIEVDPAGRLWIAVPLHSEILVHDPMSSLTRSAFRITTPESEAVIRELDRRVAAGSPFLELLGPPLWEPGPGLITGMVLSPGDGPVYLTGLGNALIRLEQHRGRPIAGAGPMTREAFETLYAEVDNAGRWGATDELGTLNLVTPEVRRMAAGELREGAAVSLARTLVPGEVPYAAEPASLEFMQVPDSAIGPADDSVWWTAERIGLFFHGGAVTHVDALSHMSYQGRTYNGGVELGPDGAPLRLAVGLMRDGIVTRGVLADLPRLQGKAYLAADYIVTAEDLEAWEQQAGVRVRSGDVLLVRTGHWAREAELGPVAPGSPSPGIHPGVAPRARAGGDGHAPVRCDGSRATGQRSGDTLAVVLPVHCRAAGHPGRDRVTAESARVVLSP
jgi:sugar lactone lactonase YvrE